MTSLLPRLGGLAAATAGMLLLAGPAAAQQSGQPAAPAPSMQPQPTTVP